MAIQLLKKCEEENRNATPDEQEILSRYVGWGGLADAFDETKSAWETEYLELKTALLSPSFLLSVYSFGIYIIARNFRSYSRGRVWAEPTKGNNHDALLVMQKNRK